MMLHPEMAALWSRSSIAGRLQYIVFDEGHCIAQWASFRADYGALGDLRHLAKYNTPFYVASATLPPAVLREVKETLHLRENTKYIMRSNNSPEIALTIHAMEYAIHTYQDLDFMVPEKYSPPLEGRLQPFFIFCNTTKECEGAIKRLRLRLPQPLRHKIKWFHSTLTPMERDKILLQLIEGKIWGICCTDAFGMVSIVSLPFKHD